MEAYQEQWFKYNLLKQKNVKELPGTVGIYCKPSLFYHKKPSWALLIVWVAPAQEVLLIRRLVVQRVKGISGRTLNRASLPVRSSEWECVCGCHDCVNEDIDNWESPVNLISSSLCCGRKLMHLEKTHRKAPAGIWTCILLAVTLMTTAPSRRPTAVLVSVSRHLQTSIWLLHVCHICSLICFF